MGEFILLMAQSKAEAQGVTAQSAIKHGQVTDEIAALCHEIGAAYLVIGQPKFQTEDNVFTAAHHAAFIEHIETQTGAKVVLPEET